MAAYDSPEQATNPLHRILLVAVPENEIGNKTITHLAEKLGVSRAAVWVWIKNEKLAADRAVQIVKLSEGRVTLDDLHKFVYRP